jgi:exosortase family protein XrtF
MKAIAAIKSEFQDVPPFVKTFLKRAITLFLLWKIVYHLILVPTRFPDTPLSTLTAYSTGYTYHLLFGSNITYLVDPEGPYPKLVLFMDGKKGIGIADGCNGLELFVLYIGFIICFPTSIRRQIAFISAGIVGIYILNIFRCVALGWMYLHEYPTDFAHHYVFKAILYGIIFFTWVKYSRKY